MRIPLASRAAVVVISTTATLAVAGPASAVTFTVDDDKADCPAAGYTSVQDAIDAAGVGDTVIVCPGAYAEGAGTPGSNGLTITKSMTLKGAGADLVTITPKKLAPGSSIADSTLNIRNGIGDLVAVVGGSFRNPINVAISGITVSGGGVASEAGIVYIDATGSITRSAVTNVTTGERRFAFEQPGGYRSGTPGYGIAIVTNDTAANGFSSTNPRTVRIESTRVDRYNRIGVLVDGAESDTVPLVSSGVRPRAEIVASEIVGRNECVNYEADGFCGSGSTQPVGELTDGPLFGQDGVRVNAGATTTISSSLLSQNRVNGTGAPVRNSATNNANLSLGSGIRLQNAVASTITTSNIVDNAYGAYNVLADGMSAATVPLVATNLWWGLRYTATTNPGPAVSPTTNPDIPENPVNGVASANGSTTVTFSPFRNGAQISPTAGEYPIASAPLPISDAAPTASLTGPASVQPGQAVPLTAVADDDIGVKKVTFYAGATVLGSASVPPYTQTATVPAGAACGSGATRSYGVVVEDSLGQTTAASTTVAIACPTPTPEPTPTPTTPAPEPTPTPTAPAPPAPAPVQAASPTIELPIDLPTQLGDQGRTLRFRPVAAAGVRTVTVFLGTRQICVVSAEPWTCKVTPKIGEVGMQTLRAVVTDASGATAEVSRPLRVRKFEPRKLSVAVGTRRLSGGRVRKTVTLTLRRPLGTTAAQACSSGTVTLVVRRGGRTLSNRKVKLDRATCTVRRSVVTRRSGRAFTVSARFGGSTVLSEITATRRFS